MLLLSTAKTTKLSDFADLETISKYQHKNSETTDFQFYTDSPIFVEVNKQNGIEVLRIKEVHESVPEIQRVRMLKIENAYCVACARQSIEEIAIGLSNGQVKIYNYRNSEMQHRFFGDKLNSVIFLDYNASDEYITAVHENGIINVYGTKTHVKLEAINIDSNSTLARFHPTKRFGLAVASYKGSVTTYDINAKRKLFHSVDSHSAPCRDLCMSAATPDILLSVGYDCYINLYDTRRKSQFLKLQHNHPLSTIAISDCGTFFCAGSLKGELFTYDMRNTKSQLCIKKVHQSGVSRVGFVPQMKCDAISNFSTPLHKTVSGSSEESNNNNNKQLPAECIENQSNSNSVNATNSLAVSSVKRDSFCEFLDFQSSGNMRINKTSNRFSTVSARDSFDWEGLKRNDNRASVLFNTFNLSPFRSRGSYSFGDSFEKKSINRDSPNQDSNPKVLYSVSSNALPLREQNILPSHASTPTEKLMQIDEKEIREETSANENINSSASNDKENPPFRLEVQRQFDSPAIEKTPDNNDSTTTHNIPALKEVVKQINDLRSEMDTRFQHLESELKFDAEQNKWQIFSQASQLWCQQIDNTEEIRSALTVLLQTDPFVVEFKRLKEENQQLKAELERLSRKK